MMRHYSRVCSRCSCCDSGFIHTYTKKKNRRYRYYTCRNRRENGFDACSAPTLPAGEIEELVIEQILRIGQDVKLQEAVFEQIQDQQTQQKLSHQEQRAAAGQQLRRIDRERAQSEKLEAPLSLIRHLQNKREEVEKLLESLENEQPPVVSKAQVVSSLQNIHNLWPSFTLQERAQFARTLLKRVDFDGVNGKVTLHFNEEGLLPEPQEKASA